MYLPPDLPVSTLALHLNVIEGFPNPLSEVAALITLSSFLLLCFFTILTITCHLTICSVYFSTNTSMIKSLKGEESLWKCSRYEAIRLWIRRMAERMEKKRYFYQTLLFIRYLSDSYLRRVCKTPLLITWIRETSQHDSEFIILRTVIILEI